MTVIASKTVEVEVEDPHGVGGQSLTYKVVAGQPVPAHLRKAYAEATGEDAGETEELYPGGDAERRQAEEDSKDEPDVIGEEKAEEPAKDKAQKSSARNK